ncbi:DUF4857 domain-containing protein [Taylorella equigenitalis]|uniref:DUF4857 domain-containing protein n=1 Tax=Taylorella equigenitalis TaxID=29575 RepID=UPI0006C46A15|nr:DUF4857 domain-containing protein [Taylorella equigenitalis]ASY29937.1 DUF4857 domain-containing protein [Taylorella equigenitalis]KOS58986.1 hypothetical protein AM589_03525 [Taylorella equigenitalis]
MIVFSRLCLYFVCVMAMASVLPSYVKQIFPLGYKTSIINYSADLDKLIFSNYENGNWSYADEDGRELSKEEMNKALPFKNLYSLMRLKQLPEKVGDWTFDPDLAYKFINRERFSAHRLDKPKLKLYTLMESNPGIDGFDTPDDLFRITDYGIEFIDLETNNVNKSKSHELTELMKSQGFNFPHKFIADSPDPRKTIDNGVFIVDSDYRVFHLKLLNGRFSLVRTDTILPQNTVDIDVLEQARQQFHAMITTTDSLLLLKWDDYRIVKVPFNEYKPYSENIAIDGDYLNWEFTRSAVDDSRRDFVVTDRDLNTYKRHHWELDKDYKNKKWNVRNAVGFFFPYFVKFDLKERTQNNIYLRLMGAEWWIMILGSMVSVFAYMLVCNRGRSWSRWARPSIWDLLFLCITSFYGLIVLLILGPVKIGRPD